MPKRYLDRPAILVDSKMSRIRIYKCTLHMLGDPEYILLLVAPYDQSLTIMRSEKSDRRAHYLERSLLDNNRTPEIFSKALIRDLFSLCEFLDNKLSYRVVGEADPDGSSITFRMVDCAVFLGEKEWQ